MEKLKKYDNIVIWISGIIFAAIVIFQVEIYTSDELWNFQNVYKMVNGYPIYQEANVIITPIFFWIGEILFKIFGTNYFIYRLYDAIIYATMILIIYNILKQVKIEKKKAFLYTLIIQYFIYTIVIGGANYNTLALTLVLLGIYISLKYKNSSKQFVLLNGIIMYLIIFTKQNIGIYYIIGSFILQFLANCKKNKWIKNIVKQIAVTSILSVITMLYLAYMGVLADFINYAFLGIKEFGSNNIAIEAMSIVYFMVAIVTIICGIFVYRKIADQEQKQNIRVFLTIGIAMILIVYPIVNAFHIMLAILPTAVLLMYLADMVLKEFLNAKIVNTFIYVMVIVFVLIAIKAGIVIIKNNPFLVDYQNPYYGVFIKQETKKQIEVVNQYIKENQNKVIIFSKEAALYNIPEKRNNGAMDLPFLGNLGFAGEDGMLEQVKAKSGYKILLTKENYWQESDKITNYIRKHYEKIGEIEEFEIYQIK